MGDAQPALQYLPAAVDRGIELRVLCHVNHHYGPSPGFAGKSTSQSAEARRAIVERCVESVRECVPGAEIRVCGIPGQALLPLDVEFRHLRDSREIVYQSLETMAAQLDRYDWFLNLEDDIELRPETWRNALAFELESLPNECLLPNRLERHASGMQCVDLRAMPGWTLQERRFAGRTFRVALNPHSAVLMLSQEKFAYALRHVDRKYRGPVVGGLMASAYAHFHKPFSLYRAYDDPEFHCVVHLDNWEEPGAAGDAVLAAARAELAEAQAELERLRESNRQLAGSAVVRLAEAVKRLPLVYRGYLGVKRLLSSRSG